MKLPMRNRIARGVTGALLAVLWLALPTRAAEVVAVRVGNHPTYTRVVFQLDAPAGYGMERPAGTGAGELVVRMDAESAPRTLDPQTVMVDRIAIEGLDDRSTARIVLRKPPSRVKERILANPPRLVFDLVFPEPMLQAVQRRGARRVAAGKRAEPTPRLAEPEMPVVVVQDSPKSGDSIATAEVPVATPDRVAAGIPIPAIPVAKVVSPVPPKPMSVLDRIAAADIDHPFYGSILGGGLLLALLMVLWLRNRTRPASVEGSVAEAPTDPDTTQEVLPPVVAAAAVPEAGVEAPSFPVPDGGRDAFETTPIVALEEPYIAAGPGLVDDEDPEKEDETMDVEGHDLQGDTTLAASPVSPTGSAAASDSEIGRRFRNFERRMEQLEARLDEALGARERLERQVAAQAEELRVQRSSIARTQRAVRSIGRESADDATEPALRTPRD